MSSHRKHTVTPSSRVKRIRSCASYRAAHGAVMFGQGEDLHGGATLT
jgi:hypothetical protein